MGMLDRINHIVVLMMENRSFDCLLGQLYPKSAEFDGLSGTESNLDPAGVPVPVWNARGMDKETMSIPTPDPGESWHDMNEQLFGAFPLASPGIDANMSGFVKNYLRTAAGSKDPTDYDGRSVMHYYLPEQVPVISSLARQFAVCDRWHASAPNQTWPNRFFAHTGTANGYENNSPPHFPYEMPTIFNRLEEFHQPWKIYFHDMPQSLTLSRLWPHADRFRLYPEFRHDAKAGTLPAYSFIEPRYFTDAALPNDMHPPHIVTLGEQLIADVYNVLRQGPNWLETLLVITYDEHGGCYDHVPPPVAVPPSDTPTAPFNFDRYGVRVPAVIVSPYIRQGTVLRPSGTTPYDHTSIIKTVRTRFNLGTPLSNREAVAPDLDAALTLPNPNNVGPSELSALPYTPKPAEIAAAQAMPLNHMQQTLLDLAAHLPVNPADGDFTQFMQAHLDDLQAKTFTAVDTANKDMIDAVAFIRKKLGTLFSSI
jgi:phospholipase C